MSENTAALWKQAMEAESDAAEVQAQLTELNRQLQWDRESLREDSLAD